MAKRTFLIALLFSAKTILHYIEAHRVKIETNLSENGTALLHALELAANALVAFLLTADYPAADEVQTVNP